MIQYFKISLPSFFSVVLLFSVLLNTPILFFIVLALSNLIFNSLWGEFEEVEIKRLVKIFETKTFHRVKIFNALVLLTTVIFSFFYWDLHAHTVMSNAIFMLALGLHASCFVVILAHEFVHGEKKIDQIFSTLLLLSSGVPHFLNEHKFGHHNFVGTERDYTTANKGENFYLFFISSLKNKITFPFSHSKYFNRILQKKMVSYQALMYILFFILIICITLFSNHKIQFVSLFIGHCLIANIFYELINYIQHYGLKRKENRDPIHPHLAWNNYYKFTNYVLYLLPLHSLHHIDYRVEKNESWKAGPAMPHFYFVMITLALLPPYWFRTMDPMLDQINSYKVKP